MRRPLGIIDMVKSRLCGRPEHSCGPVVDCQQLNRALINRISANTLSLWQQKFGPASRQSTTTATVAVLTASITADFNDRYNFWAWPTSSSIQFRLNISIWTPPSSNRYQPTPSPRFNSTHLQGISFIVDTSTSVPQNTFTSTRLQGIPLTVAEANSVPQNWTPKTRRHPGLSRFVFKGFPSKVDPSDIRSTKQGYQDHSYPKQPHLNTTGHPKRPTTVTSISQAVKRNAFLPTLHINQIAIPVDFTTNKCGFTLILITPFLSLPYSYCKL